MGWCEPATSAAGTLMAACSASFVLSFHGRHGIVGGAASSVPEGPVAAPCHRLDRGTSGIVIVAKLDPKFLRFFSVVRIEDTF